MDLIFDGVSCTLFIDANDAKSDFERAEG